MDALQLKDELGQISDALRGYLEHGIAANRKVQPPRTKAGRDLLQQLLGRLDHVSSLVDVHQRLLPPPPSPSPAPLPAATTPQASHHDSPVPPPQQQILAPPVGIPDAPKEEVPPVVVQPKSDAHPHTATPNLMTTNPSSAQSPSPPVQHHSPPSQAGPEIRLKDGSVYSSPLLSEHAAPLFDCTYQDIRVLNEELFELYSSHPIVKERGYFKLQVRDLPPVAVQKVARPSKDHATSFCYKADRLGLVKVDTGKRLKFDSPHLPLPLSTKMDWSLDEQRDLWNTSAADPPKGTRPYVIGNPLFDDVELSPGEKLRRRGRTLLEGINTQYVYFNLTGKTITTMHREDAHVRSENLLRSGQHKFWCFIKPAFSRKLEERMAIEYPEMRRCSQAVRHLSRSIPPARLDDWGIEYTLDYCVPGQAVVTEPGTYHQVLNLGPNYAVAINLEYSSSPDMPLDYRFCDRLCPDKFAISADDFRIYDKPEPPAEAELPRTPESSGSQERPAPVSAPEGTALMPPGATVSQPPTQSATPPPEKHEQHSHPPTQAVKNLARLPLPPQEDKVNPPPPNGSLPMSPPIPQSERKTPSKPESAPQPDTTAHRTETEARFVPIDPQLSQIGAGPLAPPYLPDWSPPTSSPQVENPCAPSRAQNLSPEGQAHSPETILRAPSRTQNLSPESQVHSPQTVLQPPLLAPPRTQNPSSEAQVHSPQTVLQPPLLSRPQGELCCSKPNWEELPPIRKTARMINPKRRTETPTPTKSKRQRVEEAPTPQDPPPIAAFEHLATLLRHRESTSVESQFVEALCGKSAFERLAHLVREWRRYSKSTPIMLGGMNLGKSVDESMQGYPELRVFLLRLFKLKLSECFEKAMAGAGRQLSAQGLMDGMLRMLKWDDAKRHKLHDYLREGKCWKTICDKHDGLLSLMPTENDDCLDLALFKDQLARFHKGLDTEFVRKMCAAGSTLQKSMWDYLELPEFVWESATTTYLSADQILPLLAPFRLLKSNYFDYRCYYWPKPARWHWSWPMDPTSVMPGDQPCDLCTLKSNTKTCRCIDTKVPRIPRISDDRSKGPGIRAVGSHRANDILGELVGELVPLGAFPGDWTMDFCRPDLDDEPVAAIYPRRMGNWVRKVCHASTNPSAVFRVMKISGRWRLMLVAARNIGDGEEITAKYGRGFSKELPYDLVEGLR